MELVGTRWYKCDFHLHTMQSECYESKKDTSNEWIKQVKEKGLNCIAVTDHNDYRSIDEMMRVGKENNITVFPGVEITCDSSKIHILIIFDKTKSQDNVRDFLSKFDIEGELVGSHDGTDKSAIEICMKAKEKGALVIAAHIDEYNGLGNMGAANIEKFLNRRYIDAVQVVNKIYWDDYKQKKNKEELTERLSKKYGKELSWENIDPWRKVYDKALKSKIPMLTFSDNPCAEGKSKHGLWGIGRNYTWLKMDSNPNLESIRQAFLSGDMRIRLDSESKSIPEKLPEYWIKSIKLSDSKITPKVPLNIDFSPQLNSIIGGRGSGKSSIVRLLTGGLNSANRDIGEIVKEQNNFYKRNSLKDNLGIFTDKSIIEIYICRHEISYKLEISKIIDSDNQERKLYRYNEESSCWQEVLDSNYLDFMKIKAYTQKEIFEIAKEPDALLKIIDSDIEGLENAKDEQHFIYSNLLSKLKEIETTEKIVATEGKVCSELHDIEEQIVNYKKSNISSLIEKKQHYVMEEGITKKYLSDIENFADDLKEYISALEVPKVTFSKESDSTELLGILQESEVKIAENVAVIYKMIKNILAEKELVTEKINSSEWKKEKQDILSAYDSTCNKLKADGIEVEKLDHLLQKQQKKQIEIKHVKKEKEKLEDLYIEKQNLIKKYEESFENIRNLRKTFINSILGPEENVKIEFSSHANEDSFRKMIKTLTNKDNQSINEDIEVLEKIVFEKEGIDEFRKIIDAVRNDTEYKIKLSYVFRKAIVSMDSDVYDRMKTFIPDDKLVVSYKPEGGRKFIPLSTASAGQKTTAILTFILAYGDIPLILDQPEDDLDNRLVYDLIVKRLKIAKKNRQIIVVTHNANIPVNGDAEFVTSMDSESVYVKKKYDGTLDREEIRKEICDVMEGTEYAFEMRAKKYHLNIIE